MLKCSCFRNVGFYSKILIDDSLKEKLVQLCNYKKSVQFSLLFRASRDGFGAADFHAKCDNIANTITIIGTHTGYIFGGFTHIAWNSVEKPKNSEFAYDQEAFIFSLVNHIDKPLFSRVTNPAKAIYRNPSYGPTFGRCFDIHVADRSDLYIKSYSKVGYCFQPTYAAINHNKIESLADMKYFLIKQKKTS